MLTHYNLVSNCCHGDIETRRGTDYPLGGPYGISYKYEACIKCGKSCDSVPACGNCGEVGCMEECE